MQYLLKKTLNVINQFIVIDNQGIVIENESPYFGKIIGKSLKTIHPFFENIEFFSKNIDQELIFKCINIIANHESYILDITLKTFKNDDNSLVIIDDLTRHYDNLQKVTQLRNETIINGELIAYKNHLLLEKETFKNRFIRSFSHEIRIPINTMNRMGLCLKNTNLSQVQRYNLNVVNNINDQLKHIINDILDISRIETGNFETQNKDFNIYDTIAYINNIAKQKCIEKRLEFIISMDKSCPTFINGDSYRLIQILTNLIENAVKFTSKGTIKLEVLVHRKVKQNIQLDFHIYDTGIGISPEDLKIIFKSFYQINNQQIKNNGVGLGLSIVQHLLKALNGTVTIKSVLKRGTKVTVSLPYLISNNQIPKKEKNQENKYDKNTISLLIADPFSKAETTLKNLLKDQNYSLNFVESGDAIIESLLRKKYDVVIMNLKLPKMDGIDTVRYIRYCEDTSFKDIPVILVSNKKNKIEQKLCLKNNANVYLGKPYVKKTLLIKINDLIKEKKKCTHK